MDGYGRVGRGAAEDPRPANAAETGIRGPARELLERFLVGFLLLLQHLLVHVGVHVVDIEGFRVKKSLGGFLLLSELPFFLFLLS